ncbi:hypothetical protein GOODEAATRI_012396, partial [Goodea atripinnis]
VKLRLSAILKQVSNMANARSGSLATILFLFVFPAALHEGFAVFGVAEALPGRYITLDCSAFGWRLNRFFSPTAVGSCLKKIVLGN